MAETNGNHRPRTWSAPTSRTWLERQSLLPVIVAYVLFEIGGTKCNWRALQTLLRYRLMRDTVQTRPTVAFYDSNAEESFLVRNDSFKPRSIIDMWLGNHDERHASYKEKGILTHPMTRDGQDGRDICEPAADWQSWIFPTCNKLHEVGFQLIDEDIDIPSIADEEEIYRIVKEELEKEELKKEDEEEGSSKGDLTLEALSSQENQALPLLNEEQQSRRRLNGYEEEVDGEAFESDEGNDSIFDVIDNYAPIMTLLGTGTSRDAWKVDFELPENEQESVVLKTFHYDRPFSPKSFHHQRLDAIVSERLTFSPYVADIYGYCALSVLNELGQHVDIVPTHRAMDRLRFSRDLAAGLRDAHHGLDNGRNKKRNQFDALHHDDVEFVQDNAAMVVHADLRQNNAFLSLETGKMKLSDFNQGVFLGRNKINDEPCGYLPEFSYWHDRLAAPEECMGTVQDEKTDVYHLGGMIWYFMTGFKPYHENRHDLEERIEKKDASKVNKNTWALPQLPPQFAQSRIPSIVAMKNAVTACLKFDPKERASANDIFFMLDNALSMLEKRAKQQHAPRHLQPQG